MASLKVYLPSAFLCISWRLKMLLAQANWASWVFRSRSCRTAIDTGRGRGLRAFFLFLEAFVSVSGSIVTHKGICDEL
ncbi:uncharacterized protein LY79DRAFT_553384 [Colletotrichum navitas]|uniref:Uncharacterized protein n=1 Tax=Colletotrichum navitas TaxID=681940 RepID=A0AAD8PZK0_9PEZI|nr:uncharacterized protein LY79DRAFT_553384 [Colletotrichum navitas]KAK1590870.1 hypothetical protein LY79DRAFT_553384 [Colletotrichum navitas]